MKLYKSNLLDPDISPETLQNKVQFDIRFYFARRGDENINSMTKGTFDIFLDPDTNTRYVRKVQDELQKTTRNVMVKL